jgi:hypothetical protein
LDLIADNSEAPRIEELRYQPGVGVDDSIIPSLIASLMPAFENPDQASRVFVEHVTMAVGVHVVKTYGGMRSAVRPSRGGLALWQVKRIKETLSANLEGDVSLRDLANDCGVSVSHFSGHSGSRPDYRRISGYCSAASTGRKHCCATAGCHCRTWRFPAASLTKVIYPSLYPHHRH